MKNPTGTTGKYGICRIFVTQRELRQGNDSSN